MPKRKNQSTVTKIRVSKLPPKKPRETTPQEEEAKALKAQQRAAKLKLARQAKAADDKANGILNKTNAYIWEQVQKRVIANGCSCGFQPGATWEELRPLGSGCTADQHFVCGALDTYRRYTEGDYYRRQALLEDQNV